MIAGQDPRAAIGRIKTAAIVLAVSLGFVMAMLDVTVVNVALGDIRNELHASLTVLVWTVDAYTLTFAALLLLGGSIADRLGAKRAYMLGLIWFVCASVGCAIAPNAIALIFARLLQGVGAALFMPSSLSLLTESFPDRATRTRLLGVWGAIVGIAAGSGPFVGGLLVSSFGWRSIFYLNLPIGLLGLALSAASLGPSPTKRHPFDIATHASLVLALAGLSFALIEDPNLGWTSVPVAAATALALTVAAATFARESTAVFPVIPRALARNVTFWSLNAMGFFVNFAIFGEIFVVSLYLQQALGASALTTGISMLPFMGVISLLNFSSGHLAVRYSARTVMIAGFAVATGGAVAAAAIHGYLTFWWFATAVAVCNAGIGLAIPMVLASVMHEAGASDGNVAAAALNANRQVGALAGVAIAGIVLHELQDWSITLAMTFGLFSAGLLTALILSLRLSPSSAS